MKPTTEPALNVEDEAVCKRYFNLTPKTARRYAREDKLGVPAFQIRKSRTAPWFVKVADLEKIMGKR